MLAPVICVVDDFPMSEQRSILVIESGDLVGPPLRPIMSNHGIEVEVFHEPDALLENDLERAARAICILVEGGGMGAPGAVRLVQALRERGCDTPIIVLLDSDGNSVASEVLDVGATDVIGIPLAYAYVMNRLGDFTTGAGNTEAHNLTLRDGTEVAFRFLHPKDADIEQDFIRNLSDESRYLRFFTYFKELPPGMLDVFTHNEFPRSYAVIATVNTDGEETQIGVARYAPTEEDETAEFAVVVADEWQGFGLANGLMHIIILVSALAGYRQLDGIVLQENAPMLGLAEKLGFEIVPGYQDGPGIVRVRKPLAG